MALILAGFRSLPELPDLVLHAVHRCTPRTHLVTTDVRAGHSTLADLAVVVCDRTVIQTSRLD